MRKKEFGWPLEGWTYDENGEIYTASGYTTSAQHIEAALWIMGILLKQYTKDAIYSDERPKATRPLLEPRDLGERFGGKGSRHRDRSSITELDGSAPVQERNRAYPPGESPSTP